MYVNIWSLAVPGILRAFDHCIQWVATTLALRKSKYINNYTNMYLD